MAFNHRKYRPGPRITLPDRRWPDQVITQAPRWVSVDLRDGNQALRRPMDVAHKQRLWDLLVHIGLKEIEVGFPAASQPDYDFVRTLIDSGAIPDDVCIQVLVQAREDLIVRTFQALEGVPRAIVHVYNSTSPVQRDWVFGRDRAGVKGIACQGAEWVVREATRYPDTDWTFQYSPESFTATELDYAIEVCNAVVDLWQPTPEQPCILNLPATVEVSSPNVFADQIEAFTRGIDRRDALVLSVHPHNDRGGAVAAGELALLAGADRVEGTLLGNGERTGNLDLVTLAMNLYSQGIDPGLDLSDPQAMMAVVEDCTDIPTHPRHPWVGELVYTAFSGSHQDAIGKCLKRQHPDAPWQVAYLPIDPGDLNRDYQAVIQVNSQSGKGGMAFVLEHEFGLNLPVWLRRELAPMVQRASEAANGLIDAHSIRALFVSEFIRDRHPVALHGLTLTAQGPERLELCLGTSAGERQVIGTGQGVIEAFGNAWSQAFGGTFAVLDYQEHAIGAGTEAEAAAYVLIEQDGQRSAGAAIDRDTLAAAIRALLSALNRASLASASRTDVASAAQSPAQRLAA
ncbi:2-isopropylmalate synthase [Rhabdochromatium marinum]|uniref:2-isopropylmalate synthase n=1 Tax=Rhabdochromatium marinum TaxID=48729 RepID=UPI0019070416|nr:2-isopropylmalate synthase [Rhabdochromatium marinum]MBK1649150.1 2-isopropylmalate synthase [Rhabdochromatium marinum]